MLKQKTASRRKAGRRVRLVVLTALMVVISLLASSVYAAPPAEGEGIRNPFLRSPDKFVAEKNGQICLFDRELRELSCLDMGKEPSYNAPTDELVYSRFGNIVLMDMGSEELYQVTGCGIDERRPAFSPDGGQIAFDTNLHDQRDIYLVKPSGEGHTRLTDNPADDWDPFFSPDGTRITFTSGRDGNDEIYVMNEDGSGQTRLTNDPAADHSPTWSPDGEWIAFVSHRDGSPKIYVMKPDGSDVRVVGEGVDPSWAGLNSLIFIRDGAIAQSSVPAPEPAAVIPTATARNLPRMITWVVQEGESPYGKWDELDYSQDAIWSEWPVWLQDLMDRYGLDYCPLSVCNRPDVVVVQEGDEYQVANPDLWNYGE